MPIRQDNEEEISPLQPIRNENRNGEHCNGHIAEEAMDEQQRQISEENNADVEIYEAFQERMKEYEAFREHIKEMERESERIWKRRGIIFVCFFIPFLVLIAWSLIFYS